MIDRATSPDQLLRHALCEGVQATTFFYVPAVVGLGRPSTGPLLFHQQGVGHLHMLQNDQSLYQAIFRDGEREGAVHGIPLHWYQAGTKAICEYFRAATAEHWDVVRWCAQHFAVLGRISTVEGTVVIAVWSNHQDWFREQCHEAVHAVAKAGLADLSQLAYLTSSGGEVFGTIRNGLIE